MQLQNLHHIHVKINSCLFASQSSSDLDNQAESMSKDVMDTKIAQSTPKHEDG